ncbi:MAG: hypothetical protein A2148_07115 [Chloroflexi bacterium RBG_16_68_14]|nr:MAG: hypothetical protein A2148_07115 [Chloroflexi bacterium RBG_16_68_14]
MRCALMDTERIKRKYRFNARFYDVLVRPLPLFKRLRVKAIERLRLRPGEVALDVGCGTGLSFELLEQGVGPEGRVIGVELSPDMLARAREKVTRHGWTNVALIESSAEEAPLPAASVDAVLCCWTNDIMNSKRAIANAVSALRPGGRLVATGVKLARGARGFLLNPLTNAYSWGAITTPITATPWAHLEELLGPLEVQEAAFGTAYIAYGRRRVEQE